MIFSKKSSYFLHVLLFPLFVSTYQAYAQDVVQIKKGNFSLAASQQPGPLFGFGQNVIDSGVLQFIGYLDYRRAQHQDELNFLPSFLYGITDRLAFLGFLQAKPYSDANGIHTSRVDQIGLQLEYSIYSKKSITCIDEFTGVFGSNFSTSPNIKRDFFAPSFFLGMTVSRTTVDWYFFLSPAVVLPARKGNSKTGNTVAVQAGLGRNIPTPPSYIFVGMLELNLISSQGNQIFGSLDSDSGGQVLYVGPTLWFATQSFFAQAGVVLPVYQHIKGLQNKNFYIVALNVGVTF